MDHHHCAASTSELYELLVSLLAKCPQTIEILPGDGAVWTPDLQCSSDKSFAPFLFIEGNLGVPQIILYQVYLYAVRLFGPARARTPMASQRNCDLDASLAGVLVASSSVLLVANPSHQTALNARKHLVRMRLIDPHAELLFTASLLSSQHCAKHAELWFHRRWLLSATFDPQSSHNASVDSVYDLQFASQEALRWELELTSRACELYPRNYFAWSHRLTCVRSVLSDYLAGADVVGFVSIFRNEIAEIKRWIDRHVSDYSAIHTVLALSQAALQSGVSSLMDIVVEGNLSEHAISLVQAYPAHEALWMYARTVLSIPYLQQVPQTRQFVDRFVEPLVHLQCSTGTGIKEDLDKASHYAKLFMDRGHKSFKVKIHES